MYMLLNNKQQNSINKFCILFHFIITNMIIAFCTHQYFITMVFSNRISKNKIFT